MFTKNSQFNVKLQKKGGENLLFIENVSKQYGKRIAVNNVTLNISKSQIVGILGENGAGKTTLLNIIAGCSAPTNGNVTINGLNLDANNMEAKSYIGYMPDSPPLYNDLTVHEYLYYCISLASVKKADRHKHFCDIVEILDIESVLNRKCGNLSHGLKQRINIAQSLIGNPQLILMDEPTNGLDPSQVLCFSDIIKKLSLTRGLVISSHSLDFIQKVCNRVVIMRNGKIMLDALLNAESDYRNFHLSILSSCNPVKGIASLPNVIKIVKYSEKSNVFVLQLLVEDEKKFAEQINRLCCANGSLILEMKKFAPQIEEIYLEAMRKESM